MEVIQDSKNQTLQICIDPHDLQKFDAIWAYITTKLKHLFEVWNNTNTDVKVEIRPASEIQYELQQGRWENNKNISTIVITNALLDILKKQGEYNTEIAKYKTQFIISNFNPPIE